MSKRTPYPSAMRRKALALIEAIEANRSTETLLAADEFISRSRRHEACYCWQLRRVALRVAQSRFGPPVQRQYRVTPEPRPRPTKEAISRAAFGFAGVMIIFVLLCWLAVTLTASRLYSTGGRPEIHQLADGSEITLFPHSRVKVRLSSNSRRVDLLAGGLAVKPAHLAGCPFLLAAANAEVKPLGTQFIVRHKRDGVEVELREGMLEVLTRTGASEYLRSAGEFTSVNAQGYIAPARQRSAQRAPQRSRHFRNATLSEIASAFNEQNADTQIEVLDDRGERHGFILQLDKPEAWIEELSRTGIVDVTRQASVIQIVTLTVRH